MPSSTQSPFAYFLAGGALVAAGFFLGSSQSSSNMVHAQEDNVGKAEVAGGAYGAIGVTIPNGGAALVKGKDGLAYIVDGRGVFTRASQSGKGLQLP